MSRAAGSARAQESASISVVAPVAILIPALLIVSLLFYKWRGSLSAIHNVWSSGVLSLRADVVPFNWAGHFAVALPAINYFAVIWPALVFGILISAAVRAFVPAQWITQFFGTRPMRGQIAAGAAGAPLMLCSCCVAPVFSAVYERSSRLGPSIALMLASPSLNPASLVLTFILFSAKIGAARLLMAMSAVLLSGLIMDRIFTKSLPPLVPKLGSNRDVALTLHGLASTFLRSLWYIVLRTIPALVAGVIGSMLLLQFVPKDLVASNAFRYLIVVITATIAVPLALPTFFEIPLALGLLAAGAPAGAAAALLFAGPAINLPSLFTVAKSTNWRVAIALGVSVWAIAVAGGLILP
jgi:uncharacterized membrane protein YraQ (UPF0718 family)